MNFPFQQKKIHPKAWFALERAISLVPDDDEAAVPDDGETVNTLPSLAIVARYWPRQFYNTIVSVYVGPLKYKMCFQKKNSGECVLRVISPDPGQQCRFTYVRGVKAGSFKGHINARLLEACVDQISQQVQLHRFGLEKLQFNTHKIIKNPSRSEFYCAAKDMNKIKGIVDGDDENMKNELFGALWGLLMAWNPAFISSYTGEIRHVSIVEEGGCTLLKFRLEKCIL